MRIVVTGASGMLGCALLPPLGRIGEVIPLVRGDADLRDFDATIRAVRRVSPDVVVHAAAMTNVDGCEERPDDAFRANVIATQNLACALAGSGVHFAYLSSTGIYGAWKETPYTEFDDPAPTTVHHRTKHLGEKAVAAHLPRHLVVRTGWLFGGAPGQPKNFVWKRYLEAKNGVGRLFSDPTQCGNPTFVEDLAAQIALLVEKGLCGVVNAVGEGCASRLEYVREIVAAFGLSCAVEAAPPGNFARKAPVSPNETALNYRLSLLGMNRMRDWRTALHAYVFGLREGGALPMKEE